MKRNYGLAIALTAALAAAPGLVAAVPNPQAPLASAAENTSSYIEREVRSQLAKLPYYGVFDNLAFNVAGDGKVTLYGQVVLPTVKRDAENAVKRIEGVSAVDNQVEVLPLSNYDNDIRIRAFYAIYGTPALNRYVISARPPIRIIVKNGDVTLEGVVNSDLDRQLAYARVRGLPGSFTVTNNLRLDNED